MARDYQPSLWRRLTQSLKFFRQGYRYSPRRRDDAPTGPTWGMASKRAPFDWPAFRQDVALPKRDEFFGYVDEGFALNSLVYSAVMYKARAVTAAPLRAYTGSDQPEVLPAGHQLSQLLSRPNPYQSGGQFMQLNTVYLNIAGDVFVYADRQGREPVALYSLRPDRVRIIPGDRGTLKGFIYVPENRSERDAVPMLPQDVMHVKLPNPLDPLDGLGYGLSPMSALAQSGDVDNQVTKYLKTFFEKGTLNNLILKFSVPLSDEEIAAKRKRWQEIYGGVDNWSKIGVLDDSGDVQRLGLTFDEMGFGPIDERNESRILGPFGVPPILIGSRYGLARSTYSNYAEARKAFWEDTFVPELQLYEPTFDYYLAAGEDISIRFDTSQVPALRQDVLKQIEGAARLWSMGVPANTAVQTVGLGIEDIPGGDTGYLPLNLVPVGTPRTLPAAKPAQQPTDESQPPKEPSQPDQSSEGQADATSETEQGGRKSVLRPFRRQAVHAGAGRADRLAGTADRAGMGADSASGG